VVVAGRPNVGKSSLFNRLAGTDRAIVTAIAGTTRDLVSESVDFEGLAVTLVDTAGWRETRDLVEREGVARTERALDVADVLVLVLDRSEPGQPDDAQLLARTAGRPRVVALNKSDLPAGAAWDVPAIEVSAKTGSGVGDLRHAIAGELTGRESLRDTASVSNTRHIALLEDARAHLLAAADAAGVDHATEEFVLADLQAARAKLEEVVGTRATDDLLLHIFERFCIGK
jgi:tRNA modification GTPase